MRVIFGVLLVVLAATPAHAVTIRAVDVRALDTGASFAVTFSVPLTPEYLDPIEGWRGDGFQFYIKTHEAAHWNLVLRPWEHAGQAMTVRLWWDAGSDPDPDAGGWGASQGASPMDWQRATLHFFLPWSMLGTPGAFTWGLMTTLDGGTSDWKSGASDNVGFLPAADILPPLAGGQQPTVAAHSTWGALKRLYR